MDNLNDLKAIWHTAKTDSLPDSDGMVQIIKKFRSQKLLKISALVLTAIVLVLLMVMVVFYYKSTMLSTRFGELFIIMAGTILAVTSISSLIRFYKLQDCSNIEFLKFLEQTRQRQLFYYKRTQVIAMLLCAVGLLLYIYEGVYKSFLLCLIGYGLLMVYLVIIWFVVRPRVFRKQDKKIKEKIERIEALIKQL
jgi:lysylphosphatidylglycerol synthetase-like protein (DUF2156 family)